MSVRDAGVFTVTAIALMTGTLAFLGAGPAAAPDEFEDRLVADIPAPTALAFTPDGRLLVTSKGGKVWVVEEDGQKNQTFDLQDPDGNPETNDGRLCDNEARGLLGIAVDPEFGAAGQSFIYLFHNFKKFGNCSLNQNDSPVNRVSRFEMEDGKLVPGSQDVLIDNIPSPNGNHNAGDLHFGEDGKLYVSVGDGGCNYAEKTRCQYENDALRGDHILLGKILRINPDGSIPADNPYAGDKGERCNVAGRTDLNQKCEETYASGFRYPFRFAIDPDASPGATKLFANDVGGQRVEEVDDVKAGADHGWNICEGSADNPYRAGQANCERDYAPPVHQYNHNTGCESITAGAFVPNNTKSP